MSADRIHLSVAEAREHSERALRGIGYDAEEARIIADHAIDAALCGYEFMGADLAYRARVGQLLPEGVAVDAEGRPTRDPAEARLGALLPFGGYKGFGLAFIVQALGVLAGSALDPDKDDGYLFVVLKPDLLIDPDDFKQQISALIDRIKATPRQPGVSEIRIPGERAFRSREQKLRDGIEIDRVVYEELKALDLD